MNNVPVGEKTVVNRADLVWAAYDALPKSVREFIQNAHTKIDPVQVYREWSKDRDTQSILNWLSSQDNYEKTKYRRQIRNLGE